MSLGFHVFRFCISLLKAGQPLIEVQCSGYLLSSLSSLFWSCRWELKVFQSQGIVTESAFSSKHSHANGLGEVMA